MREVCLSGSVYRVGDRLNAVVYQKYFLIGHPVGLVPVSKLLCVLRTTVKMWNIQLVPYKCPSEEGVPSRVEESPAPQFCNLQTPLPD